MTKSGVISGLREGEKYVPREMRTVVNTRMRAVSLERHCSGEETSSLGWEMSSEPANSCMKKGKVGSEVACWKVSINYFMPAVREHTTSNLLEKVMN